MSQLMHMKKVSDTINGATFVEVDPDDDDEIMHGIELRLSADDQRYQVWGLGDRLIITIDAD